MNNVSKRSERDGKKTDVNIKMKKLLLYVVINLFMPFFLFMNFLCCNKKK